MIEYDKLNNEHKAILYLLYREEESNPKGLKAIFSLGRKKRPYLAGLFPDRSNKEYQKLQRAAQELEDVNLIIAGEKVGRDEAYWAQDTKLHLKNEGRDLVEQNLEKLQKDKAIKKIIQERGLSNSKSRNYDPDKRRKKELRERDDDAFQIAMDQFGNGE